LIGAGDISICGRSGDDETAQLLKNLPGTIFTLGDNSNSSGYYKEYTECFDSSWGQFKDRIRPAVGNHDLASGTQGYSDYFGLAAGELGQYYYSYNLGSWHIIVLNSMCTWEGGCFFDSPMLTWLAQDLANNPAICTLAYWHHPLFTSGTQYPNPGVKPFWDLLYGAGAEIVLNGHDHHYERFALQDPNGQVDNERGIRQFIVGTGGAYMIKLPDTRAANSEYSQDDTFGIFALSLFSNRYEWRFIDVNSTVLDFGEGLCH
jgi:hypothetical protein